MTRKLKRTILLTFCSILLASTALAKVQPVNAKFIFNYKNINTLGALICSLDRPNKTSTPFLVRLNKLEVDKERMNSKTGKQVVSLTGVCNSEVNQKTKEIISFGQDLELILKEGTSSEAQGTLGLKKLKIVFRNNSPTLLKISDPYTKKARTFNLKQINWAKKNSIVSFSNSDNISIKSRGRIIAMEKNANLKIKDTQFYNIWSFNSFGCSVSAFLSEEKCQALMDLI